MQGSSPAHTSVLVSRQNQYPFSKGTLSLYGAALVVRTQDTKVKYLLKDTVYSIEVVAIWGVVAILPIKLIVGVICLAYHFT